MLHGSLPKIHWCDMFWLGMDFSKKALLFSKKRSKQLLFIGARGFSGAWVALTVEMGLA